MSFVHISSLLQFCVFAWFVILLPTWGVWGVLGGTCSLMALILIIYKTPASILHKSIAGRYRPVSYPDGPITARYRFM